MASIKAGVIPLCALLCLMEGLLDCSGTKPAQAPHAETAAKADTVAIRAHAPVLVPAEEMMFSEVKEFIGLGLESIKDSLWFQAGEDFDSANIRLSALEATDSLSPSVYATVKVYRDSVQKLLIGTVARTSTMSEPVPWTAQFNEDMEQVSDSTVKAVDSIIHHIDSKAYDLPLPQPMDPRVLQAMAVFMGQGRAYFTKWLSRRSRYEDLIHKKLEERDMPQDLLYLAMVESGFNPHAWSKASASGMWQFISSTGRRYGLMDDWWVDPRRDPWMATDAALDYLGDLYDEFGDWHIAMAAYNCGEGKIRKIRERDSTISYWKMPLPQETRFYVPKILAAMIIGHNPERYGFKIENPEPPLAFDTATVKYCISIGTIAKAVSMSEDTIISLNPSLRRWCTPPNRPEHMIYLPAGTRELFCRNYDLLDKTKLVNWHHHIVGKGETLSAISSRYHVSVAAIKATNKIKGNRLSRGQSLLIPLAPDDAKKFQEPDVERTASSRAAKFKGGTYRVRAGDNLFDIARRFGTTVSQLLAANNLPSGSMIKPGQRLRLGGKGRGRGRGRGGRDSDDEESHKEPLALRDEPSSRAPAARADNPSSSRVADAGDSGDDSGDDSDPSTETARGDTAPSSGAASARTDKHAVKTAAFGVYTVSTTETLFSISRKLDVSEDQLRSWNGIRGNHIQAGQKLKYVGGKPKTAAGFATAGVVAKAAPQTASRGEPTVLADNDDESSAKADSKHFYVVKSGDSLWDISVKFRSTVQKIKDLNGRLPSILKPGTRIRVK